MPGLVPTDQLTPGDLVGTNKDSYLILEKLPAEYDNRIKAMEVDEKPTEEYSDIGGKTEMRPTEMFCSVLILHFALLACCFQSFSSNPSSIIYIYIYLWYSHICLNDRVG